MPFLLKKLLRRALIGSGILLLPWSMTVCRANLPGGGTGTGANVTLTSNSTAYILSNGIVSIPILKSSATILAINYTHNNGSGNVTTQLLSGGTDGGEFYWELGGFGGAFTSSIVVDPAVGDANHAVGDYAEVDCLSTSATNGTVDIHFSMLRGSPGFYCTPVWIHRNGDTITSIGETRTNIYAGTIFSWMSTDAIRNRQMDTHSDSDNDTVEGAPVECSIWTSGFYQGQYEDKYKYSVNQGVGPRAWGWMSVTNSTASTSTANGFSSNTSGFTGANVGLFDITASPEYYGGGPMKRDLMDHIGITILNMFASSHYGGGTDTGLAVNEVWAKAYGPYFTYCNSLGSAGNFSGNTSDPIAVSQFLLADAQAQATAEASAWPYSWFINGNYTPASGRGNITGTIVIHDAYNPNASAAGLYVGAVQQPSTTGAVYDFQLWEKAYQFWTKTDANGNFTIPNVIAGSNYTLYAFGPGAAGTLMSQNQSGGNPPITFNLPSPTLGVAVTGGGTTNVGTVTWTPTRVGPTVWEIGYPNRTGDKFRHGDDYWRGDLGPSPTQPSPVWSKFLEFPFDFPNGMTYTVGASQWPTGWNFIFPVVTSSTGTYGTPNANITFNLAANTSLTGNASLYIALSSDYEGALILAINGKTVVSNSTITGTPTTSIPSTGYIPSYSGSGSESDASIREGNHGMFSDERITFPANMLKTGSNTINFTLRQVGGTYFADHAMFDYLRLELTGYVPPAPAGVAAYPGNNTVLLSWPVTPGATSYNILRSLTTGGNYTSIASNITGPVLGSGPANDTYLDSTAANGTPYYYVVQSVNPVGTSGNSTQGTTTPSSSSAPAVPATPTGLSAAIGNASIALSWAAATDTNYYTLYRSTIVNAVGTVNYTTLSNTITGNTFTDTTPTNGVPYLFYLTATNAAGTSANSNTTTAIALPSAPSLAPGNVTINGGNGSETLSWTPVPGAVGYVIYRSTSLGGTPTYVTSATETTYTDSGLNNNTNYFYTITAMNAAGFSSNVTTNGSTAPAAPVITGLGSTGNVTLNWANVTGAANYTIQRSTTTGTEVTIASGITGNTYLNTGLTNGTTVFYVVDAVNSSGATSADSNEIAVTPLAIPANLTIAGNTGNTTLSWTTVPAAGNYTVRRATVSGGPYTTINSTVTVGNLTDVTVANGTPYFYVVAAANSTTDVTSAIVSLSLSGNSTQVAATPLAAPIGLTAATSTGNATISWGNVTGATSYAVRRGNVTGGPYVTINSTITASPFVDTGLTNGNTYFYVVAAQATGSLSSNSTQATAIPVAPPTGVSATGNTGNVTLGWTASLGATSYVVRRGTITGGPYTTLTSSATGTAYTDITAVNGTTYFYVLAALNSTGLSTNSTEVFATPLAPVANLTATPGNGNVSLNWTGSAGASGYTIKRSTTSGSGYANLATGVTGTTYKDSTAVNGTTYYYVVVATNTNSGSNNSAEVNATPVAPPAAPTGLTATPGNTTVTLNWSSVSGAATYNVLRSTTSGSGYATVASALGNTTYTDPGLTNGNTYYYVVSATNAGGTSPNSAEVSAIPAQNLAQWTATYFPGVSDPNVIGPAADPDGDGLSNLVEYLLGTNPTVPDSAGAAMSSAADGDGNLVLTFRLSKNLTGLTYTVQSSTDLVNWTDTGVTPTVQSDQGAYYIMQATVPIGSNSKLLLRLNVTASGN
jgi:fibronectin type 3 domain-containing protein